MSSRFPTNISLKRSAPPASSSGSENEASAMSKLAKSISNLRAGAKKRPTKLSFVDAFPFAGTSWNPRKKHLSHLELKTNFENHVKNLAKAEDIMNYDDLRARVQTHIHQKFQRDVLKYRGTKQSPDKSSDEQGGESPDELGGESPAISPHDSPVRVTCGGVSKGLPQAWL